jgi:predicted esterase
MSNGYTFDQLRQELMQLYNAGDYAAALKLVNAEARSFPEQSARITFWKMCLFSRDGCLTEALSVFRQGLDNGLWWAESQFLDSDLDPLRDLPEYKELVAESVQRWEQGRRQVKREHLLLLPDARFSSPYPLIIALHGHNGDKHSNLEHWGVARQQGWAVLSAQSTQPLYPWSYCWDDPVPGLQDIQFYIERTLETNEIDREKVLIGGFSQGSGMAIYAALSGVIPVRGFVASATWWQDVASLAVLAAGAKNQRGYFVTGEKDHTLTRAREIQDVLKQNHIPFAEELHPGLGHEFPPGFDQSFTRALEFLFKE